MTGGALADYESEESDVDNWNDVAGIGPALKSGEELPSRNIPFLSEGLAITAPAAPSRPRLTLPPPRSEG